MLSIVAQLLVPGWQMVTLVVSMLRVRPGAVVTAIGCTLGVFDCGTAALVLGLDAAGGALAVAGLLAGTAEPVCGVPAGVLLLPPPPQPVRAAQTRSRAYRRGKCFMAW